MKTRSFVALTSAFIASATAHAEPPRYLCILTPSMTCDQDVPDPIISDLTVPTQNSFGPFACTQFWGTGTVTASAFSSFGIVGVDIENDWNGCLAFGCGPGLLNISASATHEFEVIFSSPTSDPIDVRMNLYFNGNIQEDPGQYRRINAQVNASSGQFFSGVFGQIDDPDAPEVRKGLLSQFNEITGLYVSTPEFTNIPVNVPVRFGLNLWVENAITLETGGAVNFARGMRLQGTPFTITGTAPGVSPDDIDVNSPGANIVNGTYNSAACFASDVDGSGIVDLGDLNIVLGNFGASGVPGDTSGDGEVDLADLNLILSNFGADCSQP